MRSGGPVDGGEDGRASGVVRRQLHPEDPPAGDAYLRLSDVEVHRALPVADHRYVGAVGGAALEDGALGRARRCWRREGVECEGGPVLILDPRAWLVHRHEEPTGAVPHGNALVRLSHRQRRRPAHDAPVPCVHPRPRRDPHRTAADVLACVVDGGNKGLVQMEVLQIGRRLGVLGPVEVAPCREQ